MHNDPLSKEIYQKQEILNDESRLIPQNKTGNSISTIFSMILVIGVLIGLVRILIIIFH